MKNKDFKVFRTIGLPVSIFDKFKDIQRAYSDQGKPLDNSQVIAELITNAHQQMNDTVRGNLKNEQPNI
ncbi:hypothetical protein [Thiomicrorhabdus sp. Kp2]|uniref:hypothetical protein n=1 Tax=Thiomicrorhabdus sp. Kp2 TaxID=1123518 RepID=UPI0003F8112F|nr:hypothetical protein [Thiomicrorhabdus sp. Kp2]